MDIGPAELIIVLVIVLLLFGPSRIGKVAGELGKGIRDFRDGLTGKSDDKPEESAPEEQPPASQEGK